MRYFKFYPIGRYWKTTLRHLFQNKVYVSSIINFNDPFEGLWFDNNTNMPVYVSEKNFLSRLNRCGIFCMSSGPTSKFICSPKSILMWSHYASSHTGFCIEFNENILATPTIEYSGAVRYEEDMPDKLSQYDYDNLSYKDKKELLFWKSKVWEYEQETRLCFSMANQYVDIPSGSIVGIYCGCNMNPHLKTFLKLISSKLGWEYHTLELDNKAYYFNLTE